MKLYTNQRIFKNRLYNSQIRGFSLIEVIIATLVLGVSVFGIISGLTQSAKRVNSQAGIEFALLTSQEFMTRMQINLRPENRQDYLNLDSASLPPVQACLANGCSPAEIAAHDKLEIIARVQARLAEPRLKLIAQNDTLQLHLAWKSASAPFQSKDCFFDLSESDSCVVQGQADL